MTEYQKYCILKDKIHTNSDFLQKIKESITSMYCVYDIDSKTACFNYTLSPSLNGEPTEPIFKHCEHFCNCHKTDCPYYSKHVNYIKYATSLDSFNKELKQIPLLKRMNFWFKKKLEEKQKH